MLPPSTGGPLQDPTGSVRGRVTDGDFGVPLAGAQVQALETGQKALTGEQGNYLLAELKPGTYTLVFTRDGYEKQVRADVLVGPGRMTEIDVALTGEVTDMDEFIVEDLLQFGAGTEASLFKLRFESPALLDSIGSELIGRAGAGDAASALRLVAGASIQNGKYAVIRGLPDRYISSQMNGVRLPSADEDKRAVELDQFPASVIESIQVSKTFMPNQQGDASGGAVDLRLKGIPDGNILTAKAQASYNTQFSGRSDFLTYDGGDRQIQWGNLGGNWEGAVGTTRGDAPIDYKWSIAAGGRIPLGGAVTLGGYASIFYEDDSVFDDSARDNSFWVSTPGGPMVPQTNQGSSSGGDFKTELFDVQKSRKIQQLGGLGTLGIQGEGMSIGLTALLTRNRDDVTTLATDTSGKSYYFPGYDVNDPQSPGNDHNNVDAAPWLRLETLEYSERTTGTLQLTGKHELGSGSSGDGDFRWRAPEIRWTLSHSNAGLDQPDKRQFGALWHADSYNPGTPPFIPPHTDPAIWLPYPPAANFNLGNLQRIWKDIEEVSNQAALDLTFPFERWEESKGALKVGLFDDQLTREFNQETFSNFGDAGASYVGGWDDPWSSHFPDEDHPINESLYDVDYDGSQHISAVYGMLEVPLSHDLTLSGGARLETTTIEIVNDPEANAVWFPPGTDVPVDLNPGDADVEFQQQDLLPAIGLAFEAFKGVTLRASYSRTVAHQTFKELTPIVQQEYLGGPIFIGNPELEMSSLDNYDLRVDYVPYQGGLWSASWFKKDVEKPIEYVQRLAGFGFTTPVNYPKGELSGYEFELRQDLSHASSSLQGFSVGANATFIDSEVSLPESEAAGFDDPGIQAPMHTRDMTNAPDHLYNFFLTYDFPGMGTQASIFYTIQGDTLIAGAAQSLGNFVPSLYAKEYDTLNFVLTHDIGKRVKLGFQAKNLTNPSIEEVYRSPYIDGDVTKTSYTKGVEFSLGLSLSF